MSGTTEEATRFKKAYQTVNGGENNKTVPNKNDEYMKTFGGTEQNRNEEPRPANSKREHDLQEKGYTTKPTDEELDDVKELKQKLDKRGN